MVGPVFWSEACLKQTLQLREAVVTHVRWERGLSRLEQEYEAELVLQLLFLYHFIAVAGQLCRCICRYVPREEPRPNRECQASAWMSGAASLFFGCWLKLRLRGV